MPDAATSWERGITSFGHSMADAIDEFAKRHKQSKDEEAKIDFYAKMPRDPNDPNSKPLIDQKTADALHAFHRAHGAYAAGAMDAYFKSATGLAATAAKAKVTAGNVSPVYDPSGRQIGERDKGKLHVFPQWLVTGGKKAKTELEKGLSKHGLTPEDLASVDQDSLKFLDVNEEEVKAPLPSKDIKRKPGSREPAEGVKPEVFDSMEAGAKYIGGTARGKDFVIPIKDFRRYVNMLKGGQDNVAEAPAEMPIVSTPDEARKLPPGTVFKTKSGRILRVPGGKSQSSVSDQSDETDNNGE